MNNKLLFKASAIIEIMAGLAFLAAPSLVVDLLLGEEIGAVGVTVARVLGIGLLSLGVACWETPGQTMRLAPRVGLCLYNVGATIVFVIVGTSGGMNGILLWPAAILHAVIGAMMLWVILAAPRNVQS